MSDERAEAAAARIVNCLGIEMRDEHHRRVWIKSAGECVASVYAELGAENERLRVRLAKVEEAARGAIKQLDKAAAASFDQAHQEETEYELEAAYEGTDYKSAADWLRAALGGEVEG